MTRFHEEPAPGLEQAYQGTLLHAEESAFQKIEVYEHPTFGRMLVLDGLVQTTTRDEFCYHEMLVHVPMIAVAEPRRVLIIGGGDGGTLRRVLEHATVTEAVMVEIDETVTTVSREFFPEIAGDAFDDPRATVLFDDGAAYVRDGSEPFDAIVIDSSDPVGPGVVLFSEEFYGQCRVRLNPGGVLSAQIGSPFYFPDEIAMALGNAAKAFPQVKPYVGAVPTYPGTLWGYMLAGERIDTDADTAGKRAAERGLQPRYWTPEIQAGAFAVPAFVAEVASGSPVFPKP
ncbi:MAG TPA: polyamine aminopropyltransferase [Actinomycetota bacterium]|nr:polyamine aminopropyltransferase [Actinomycetota bacterium]